MGSPARLRAYLERHYGRPEIGAPSSWERVEAALAHRQPDRVPFDFWAVPRSCSDSRRRWTPTTRRCCACWASTAGMVTTRYVGSRARELPDGSFICPWGTDARHVANEFSVYDVVPGSPWPRLRRPPMC